MQIIKLLHSQNPGASGLVKNTTVDVATPVDRNGRKVYRQSYYLHFRLDADCHGIVMDMAASRLQGHFDDYNLHLTAGDNTFQTVDWEAVKEDGSTTPNLVKVHLTHPWRLQSVSTIDNRGVDVMRLDGAAVGQEPTLSGNSNSFLSGEFIGQDFALRRVAPYPVTILVEQQPPILSGKIAVTVKNLADVNAMSVDDGFSGGIQTQVEMVAAAAHGIRTINLRSVPTGPRILLGEIGTLPDVNATLLSIWQLAGEQTRVPVRFLMEEDQHIAALGQIQLACARFFTGLGTAKPPAHLYLPIIFESDTPTRLCLTALDLRYSLLRNRLDGLEAKHTLKFSGAAVAEQQLFLGLPVNSVVQRAEITLISKLKPGFALNGMALSGSLTQHTGVDMSEGFTVANRLQLPQPLLVGHALLAVVPLTETVQAELQIVADIQDAPAGTNLAQIRLELKGLGERQWAVACFTPALLGDGACWLRLTIRQGRLLWLGQSGEGHVQISPAAKAAPGKTLRTLQLLNTLIDGGASDNGATGVSLSVAGLQASAAETSDDTLVFNLTAPLNGHFTTGTAEPALLRFTSGGKGNVILKNLQVEYDI